MYFKNNLTWHVLRPDGSSALCRANIKPDGKETRETVPTVGLCGCCRAVLRCGNELAELHVKVKRAEPPPDVYLHKPRKRYPGDRP